MLARFHSELHLPSSFSKVSIVKFDAFCYTGKMEFGTAYLTEQIIAYIGNKRKLLTLIYKAMQECGASLKPGLKFFDAFSGSGVVSRFAKSLGFEVFSNDWEYYSKIINTAFLTVGKSDIKKIFGSEEKFCLLLKKINSLPAPAKKKQFIAKYYAPKEFSIEKADFRTERLFYTRQNALNIDKIRNYIEENYPSHSEDKSVLKARSLLLALLLYEAATHTNTSGVFKAFHKEFGGHGKDALKRILAPIELHFPQLIDSDFPCHVFKENANELAKDLRGIDIAYLDPPYNQHQYGSNYFMLNTIAKWDFIAPSLELNESGRLREKAGIRHDWVQTRSPYCSRADATQYFADLVQNLDAKYILVSYSTDGIIPFSAMCEICMKKGYVSVVTNEYTTYRGGKQSNKRQNSDIEFILCIDTSRKSNKKSAEEIEAIFAKKELLLLFRQRFCRERLKKASSASYCSSDGKTFLKFEVCGNKIQVQTDDFFVLKENSLTETLSASEAKALYSLLFPCACATKEEELGELLQRVAEKNDLSCSFAKLIPATLKKLASKKNRLAFEKWLGKVRGLKSANRDAYNLIEEKIDRVEEIAKIRWAT